METRTNHLHDYLRNLIVEEPLAAMEFDRAAQRLCVTVSDALDVSRVSIWEIENFYVAV